MFGRIKHKFQRFSSFYSKFGLISALIFEFKWSLRLKEILVKVHDYPSAFIIRRFTSDAWCFKQVFIDDDLYNYLPESPNFIIDGGANVGYTAAFYANRYPNATIVAIEPSQSNCEMIKRNCENFNNVELVQGALWGKNTSLKISNPDDHDWGFVVEECDPADKDALKSYTISDIIEKSGQDQVDMIKLDIEGAERELFSSNCDDWLPIVKSMAIEIHGSEANEIISNAVNKYNFNTWTAGNKTFFVKLQSFY